MLKWIVCLSVLYTQFIAIRRFFYNSHSSSNNNNHHHPPQSQSYLQFNSSKYYTWEIFLAVGGLSSALIISWFDNFDSVVATDCSGVYEFMPSISACIGDFAPQRYIWRLCVALFVPIRFIDGFVIYYHNSGVDVVEGKENIVNRIAIWCYCVEYFSLFLLTYVSSSDHLGLHVLGFSCFMIFSLIYSSLTVLKRYWFYQRVQKSEYFIWKGRVYVMNVCFAIGAVIAWVISKRVCISGLYSLFALLEWGFVFTNIFFHVLELCELGPYFLQGIPISYPKKCLEN